MISVDDLVCIPYVPDLTEAGILYVCRSLPRLYDRMGGTPFERLRRIVAGISVELAFRRYLTEQNIPFGTKGAEPFTGPDHYDVSLGGHRCDIKSFLISHRDQISSLHAHPGELLKAPALVTLDEYGADTRSSRDLYLFSFLTGLVANSPEDIKKASNAGKPLYLIHTMPPAWVRPRVWAPLGLLALKLEGEEPITVELGGQNTTRDFVTHRALLEPQTRLQLDLDLYSLSYVHVESKPAARLGIYSSTRNETYLIQPVEWGNIWVYGMRIYLTGWITSEAFRQKASLLPSGSRVFQYDRTRTKNLAMPIGDLHPLPELLSRTRAWAQSRSKTME